ncbi:Response regulator receiver domain-containing protein [Fulvimarina manganoxydans]|uniref:Response regulator receiver domain-containing protein n=1 Tax=Fulvimarina manganoxydans TaxID=937218 RepID=A0A1W2A8D3_9HYPH|nr:Response regulator receiver domain-containing protein [Fulvimarina manganoxydans]
MTQTKRLGVLVVESDPLLLLFASDAAADAGLIPYEARDSARALQILNQDERDDLGTIFVDTDLAERADGMDLAWTVHRLRPDIRIVVTSAGRTPDPKTMPPGCIYFGKPYNIYDLMSLLREAFSASAD